MEQEVGGSSPPNCTTPSQPVKIKLPTPPAWAVTRCPPLLANPPAVHPQFAQIIAPGGIYDDFPDQECSVWLDAGDGALGFDLAHRRQAYTPEQQQACTGDAFRLCSPKFPTSIASPPAWSATSPSSRRPAGRSSGRIPSRRSRGRAGRPADGDQAGGEPAQSRQCQGRKPKSRQAGEEARRDLIARRHFKSPSARQTDALRQIAA